MAGLHFPITGDNSNFLKALRDSERGVEQTAQVIQQSGMSIEDVFTQMKNAALGFGAAFSAQQFVSNVMAIRGQFQQLEVAFNTMLGSAEKGQEIMQTAVETAAKTPFSLEQVAGGFKQLLAYGLEAEKVNDTLVRLGDIAAGLSIPLGDLVYLYGTTMTQGKMNTMDLRQFMGRGIPMVDELAKVVGLSESAKNEVYDLVSQGKIGFKEMEKAIINMTSAGGKFGGLMAAQSQTITGQISNLEDSFDQMFNEIGQNSEGIINDAIGLASLLVENYEKVGGVLLTLVSTYGVYKASLMALNAYNSAAYKYQVAQLQAVINAKDGEVVSDNALINSNNSLVSQRMREVNALKEVIAAKIEEATVTERMASYQKHIATIEKESVEEKLNAIKEEIEVAKSQLEIAKESGDAKEQATAKTNLATLAEERNKLSKQSNNATTQLGVATKNLEAATQARATLVTNADTVAKRTNSKATALLSTATGLLTGKIKALGLAFKSNPIGFLLTGVTMAIGVFSSLSDSTEELSAEIERFGENAIKQINNIETLFAVLNNTSSTSKVHKEALEELSKVYEDYGVEVDNECSKLDELNARREELIRLIKEEGRERQVANQIASYQEALSESAKSMRESLRDALGSAEWESSGLLDDFDADEYQERATELSIIIGDILESEAEGLAELTGDAYEDGLERVSEKIKKVYRDLGLDIYRTSFRSSEDGKITTKLLLGTDVGEIDILREYIDKIKGIVKNREKLISSNTESVKVVKEEGKSVDYTTKSFSELLKTAFSVNNEIKKIDNADTKPKVDTTEVDKALTQAQSLYGYLKLLDGYRPKALKDYIPKEQQGNIVIPYLPGMQPEPKQEVATDKVQLQDMSQSKALDEIYKRVKDAKTENSINTLITEIDSSLKDAVIGSDEYKKLKGLKSILETKKGGKNGLSVQEQKSNIIKSEQELNETLIRMSEERSDLVSELSFKEEQQRIELEKNETARRLMQIKLDNKKELQQLEKEERSEIEAEIQRQKDLFDAQEDLKKTNNKNYVKKIFTADDIDQNEINKIKERYSSIYDKTIEVHNAKIRKYWDDVVKTGINSMQEYYKQYGNYEQKKAAITILYQNKIKESTSVGDKLILEEELKSELRKLDEDYGYVTSKMADLFEDAGDKSINAIDAVIKKYESLVMFKSQPGAISRNQLLELGFTNEDLEALDRGEISLKDITDAIKKLKKELGEKSPFKSFVVDFNKALEEIKSGNVTKGISGISSAVNGFLPSLKEFAGNISTIFDFEDEKIQKSIDAIGGLGTTALGVGQALSGDIGGGIMTAVGGIAQIVDAVEGLFGADHSEFLEMEDRYRELVEIWDVLISRKKEYIEQSYGVESQKAGKEAIELLKKEQEEARNIGKAWLKEGASVGSHSYGYRQREALSKEALESLKNFNYLSYGKLTRTGDLNWLFEMSAEQLKELQSKAVPFWNDLSDEVKEYLQTIIDAGDEIKETEEKMKEAATGVSFEGFKDNFISALTDMETSAEDIADDISDYFFKAMLSAFVSDEMSEEIRNFYDSWAKDMEDGKLDRDIESYQEEWSKIVEKGIEKRNNLAEVTGYESNYQQQDASKSAFSAMSQDTADELNGRFTALQIAGEGVKNQVTAVAESLKDFLSISTENGVILSDMRDLIASNNGYLADIAKYTKMNSADIKLILENTNRL